MCVCVLKTQIDNLSGQVDRKKGRQRFAEEKTEKRKANVCAYVCLCMSEREEVCEKFKDLKKKTKQKRNKEKTTTNTQKIHTQKKE